MTSSLTQEMEGSMKALFDRLVGGNFSQETNYAITEPKALTDILAQLPFCELDLQLSVLNRLLHSMPSTLRNTSRCHQYALVSLLHLALQQWDQRVQAVIHSLIIQIGSRFISLEELKRIFLIIAPSGGNGSLDTHQAVLFMRTIREMANQHRPDACFDFTGGTSALHLPLLANWPNRQGYSIACWLSLERDNPNRRQYLFSFHSQGGDAVEAYFYQGRLFMSTVKNRGRPSERLIQYQFESNTWYFLTISHSHSRLLSSELTVCINGQQVGGANPLKYPRAGQSYIATYVGCNAAANRPSNASAAAAAAMSAGPSTPSPPPLTSSALFGQIGGFHLFDIPLTEAQAMELWGLGPNAIQSDTTYKIPAKSSSFPLALPSLFSRVERSHLLLSYHPRAVQGRIALNNVREGSDGHAQLEGEISLMHMPVLETQLHSIGGMTMLFPLYASLCHEVSPPEKAAAMAYALVDLTTELLRGSSLLQTEMDDVEGFDIMGYHLRHASPMYFTPGVIDRLVVLSRELFVGPLIDSFYSNIFFDYDIWIRTSDDVLVALSRAQQAKLQAQPHYFRTTLGIRYFLDALRSLQALVSTEGSMSSGGEGTPSAAGPRSRRSSSFVVNSDSVTTLQMTIRRSISMLLKEADDAHPITKDEMAALMDFIQECTDAQLVADVFVIVYDLLADETIHPSLFHRILDIGGSGPFIHILHHDVLFVRITSLKAMGKYLQNCPSECTSKFRQLAAPSGIVMAHGASSFASSVLDVLSHHPACQATYLSLLELALEHVTPPSLNRQVLDLGMDAPGIRNPYLLLAVLRLLLHADIQLQLTALQDLTLLLKHSQSNLHMWSEVPGWPQHPFALVVAACRQGAAGTRLPVEKHQPDDVCDPDAILHPSCSVETQTLASMVVGLLDTVLTSMIHKDGGWMQWREALSFAGLAEDNSGRLLREPVVTRQLMTRFLMTVSSPTFLAKHEQEPAEAPFWTNLVHFLLAVEGHLFVDGQGGPVVDDAAEDNPVDFEFVDMQLDESSSGLEAGTEAGATGGGGGGGGGGSATANPAPANSTDSHVGANTTPQPTPPRKRRNSAVDTEKTFLDRVLRLSGWLWDHLLQFDGAETTHGTSPAKKGFGSFVLDLLPNPFRSSSRQAEEEALFLLNIFPAIRGLSARANALLRVHIRSLLRRVELGGSQFDVSQLEQVLFVSSSNYITALACRDNPSLVPVNIKTEWPHQWLSFLVARLHHLGTAGVIHSSVAEDCLRLMMNIMSREPSVIAEIVQNPVLKQQLGKGRLSWMLPTAPIADFVQKLKGDDWRHGLVAPVESQRQLLESAFRQTVSNTHIRAKENAVKRARSATSQEAGRLKEWEDGRYQIHLRDAYSELTRRTVAGNMRAQRSRKVQSEWQRIWWELTSEHGIWRTGDNENNCPGPNRQWMLDASENLSRMHSRLVQGVRSDAVTPASWDYKEAEEPDSVPSTPTAMAPGSSDDLIGIDGSVREFIRRNSIDDLFKGSTLLQDSQDGESDDDDDDDDDGVRTGAKPGSDAVTDDAASTGGDARAADPKTGAASESDSAAALQTLEDAEEWDVVASMDDAPMWVPREEETGVASVVKHGELIYRSRAALVKPNQVEYGFLELTKRKLHFTIDRKAVSLTKDDQPDPVECEKQLEVQKHAEDVSWNLQDIRSIMRRRYLLRESAFEMFTSDRCAHLFNCARDKVMPLLKKIKILSPCQADLRSAESRFRRQAMTQRWQAREISNYDYLMYLNTLAGRTFNDFSQYPVFPWVLADYDSPDLDLSDPKSYRDLSKPMGALNEERLAQFLERYENFSDSEIPQFLYGTHYSNPGSVLYFLVRLEPYTSKHIELQSGKFDVPDRMFHSLGQTYANCAGPDNLSDVKEAIPELYSLPDLYLNRNELSMGTKQDGEKLNDVALPPWATSAYDLVEKMRAALESEYVSANLHHWIDLIFGFKQRGAAAVKAHNVFYFLTYAGTVDIDAVEDPIQRKAFELQIASFGQTPIQLTNRPHPARGRYVAPQPALPLGPSGLALRNVNTAASTPTSPVIAASFAKGEVLAITSTLALNRYKAKKLADEAHYAMRSGGLPGLAQATSQLPFELRTSPVSGAITFPFATTTDLMRRSAAFYISRSGKFMYTAGHWDCSVRVSQITSGKDGKAAKLVQSVMSHVQASTCLAATEDDSWLVTGSRDCTVRVWKMNERNSVPLSDHPVHILRGHSATISCVAVSLDLDLVVSGSSEGMIHSLSRGRYIRHLEYPTDGVAPISAISVSRKGIFVTSVRDGTIHIFSVNGFYRTALPRHQQPVSCMQVLGTQALVAGTPDGHVLLYDLNATIVQMDVRRVPGAVTSIDWDEGLQVFVVGLQSGLVVLFPFYSASVDYGGPLRLLNNEIV